MTADATLPASDDLTPEALARIETVDEQTREAAALYLWDEGIVRPEHLARQVINALVDDGWRPSGPALLSGVRSRDTRIAELDEEIATLRQQRSDNLKAIAERDAQLRRIRSILAGSGTDVNSTNMILDVLDE